ncbi:helix-turn-helix domain-containing protein [Pseudoalteromonas sp. ZZD1]|uniref:helix-turn-helix domain-containing protein n=1 Tax=Pseudoalteromonas sp. ZZD1 TaxID=3139395 RepID=UPI003BA913A0
MQSVIKLIGKNIKIARVTKGWSQAELAHHLHVEQSYISRIESGSIAMSCERIYEIMFLLGCDTDDIFPSADNVKINIKSSTSK